LKEKLHPLLEIKPMRNVSEIEAKLIYLFKHVLRQLYMADTVVRNLLEKMSFLKIREDYRKNK